MTGYFTRVPSLSIHDRLEGLDVAHPLLRALKPEFRKLVARAVEEVEGVGTTVPTAIIPDRKFTQLLVCGARGCVCVTLPK